MAVPITAAIAVAVFRAWGLAVTSNRLSALQFRDKPAPDAHSPEDPFDGGTGLEAVSDPGGAIMLVDLTLGGVDGTFQIGERDLRDRAPSRVQRR